MLKFKLLFIILLAVILYPPQLTALPEYPLISEAVVDVTGAESDSEFVEIYNPTGAPINIGGWDIGYKTTSGSSWSSVSAIPAGETIPAFGYYLIGGDKVSPAPDHIDASLGFSASGGHIALRNYSNVIIDKLGYGNAIDPEVSAIAAPGIDKSLERKSTGADTQGNAYETNNNSNDFVICNIPCPQNKYSQSEIPPYSESAIFFANPLISQFGNFNVSVIDAD
ncbi:MAG TPA: lamin tail domain-containing protein, partial [bacterium]|nr:lamin tail domain-containing protein [bacterium]